MEYEWRKMSEQAPTKIDVRIRLKDGSELNVWTQEDGDFYYGAFDRFVSPDLVVEWCYIEKKP